MRATLALIAALALPAAAPAQQAETLADIRQDIAVLYTELQRLRQELNTTGLSDTALTGSALDRLNSIEAELRRVTARTEELGFRIEQVVQDGTNRLGDLDFRVCELEPGCDIGQLGDTPRLGGAAAPSETAQTSGAQGGGSRDLLPGGAELAVGEERDFQQAMAALDEGDFAKAAQLFAGIRQAYPMGPLEAPALVGEGLALEGSGDIREAARRYLDAYSGFPDAEIAPEALWRLGTSLAELGSVPEACVTLAEVGNRYPASSYVNEARSSMADLNCQ